MWRGPLHERVFKNRLPVFGADPLDNQVAFRFERLVLFTIFFQRQIKISQPRRQVEKIFIGPQLMRTGIVLRPSQPRKIATPQK